MTVAIWGRGINDEVVRDGGRRERERERERASQILPRSSKGVPISVRAFIFGR
jgi:hypothetical protein